MNLTSMSEWTAVDSLSCLVRYVLRAIFGCTKLKYFYPNTELPPLEKADQDRMQNALVGRSLGPKLRAKKNCTFK